MNTARDRYARFLHADGGQTFAEWLRIDVPVLDYNWSLSGGRYRYKSSRAEGEWQPTKGEAKANYKAALKKRRAQP